MRIGQHNEIDTHVAYVDFEWIMCREEKKNIYDYAVINLLKKSNVSCDVITGYQWLNINLRWCCSCFNKRSSGNSELFEKQIEKSRIFESNRKKKSICSYQLLIRWFLCLFLCRSSRIFSPRWSQHSVAPLTLNSFSRIHHMIAFIA